MDDGLLAGVRAWIERNEITCCTATQAARGAFGPGDLRANKVRMVSKILPEAGGIRIRTSEGHFFVFPGDWRYAGLAAQSKSRATSGASKLAGAIADLQRIARVADDLLKDGIGKPTLDSLDLPDLARSQVRALAHAAGMPEMRMVAEIVRKGLEHPAVAEKLQGLDMSVDPPWDADDAAEVEVDKRELQRRQNDELRMQVVRMKISRGMRLRADEEELLERTEGGGGN